MTPAIRVENLSKLYRIGARQDGYMTLRESLTHATAAPWRNLRKWARRLSAQNGASAHNGHVPSPESVAASPSSETIWALKDVSFDVQPGEVVGIIGRNGAGKSTLLKILSRITEPTSGRIQLNGRVASLLEVGTGFHPELTGRENIYLNGAILGMTRREIQRKFDEIVDFAEIDQFIDTPVKRYSSGMYVRLAFAVAAHLDPEILVIDEVLAVGDAKFQNKSLGRMKEVSQSGRTVLFVSHNMAAVRNLCNSAILIQHGRIRFSGDCVVGVSAYLDSLELDEEDSLKPHRVGISLGKFIHGISIFSGDGLKSSRFSSGDAMAIRASLNTHGLPEYVNVQLTFHTTCGDCLFTVATQHSESGPLPVHDRTTVVCQLDQVCLAPGDYILSAMVGAPYGPVLERIMPAARIHVDASDFYGNGSRPTAVNGHYLMRSQWNVETISPAAERCSSFEGELA
jgi:lipopolysaccharide transport system ATP-binding protein